MAATWLKPLHVNKGKTIAQTITDRTDYADNPHKTRYGDLVTGYACDPRTADAEFMLSKKEYLSNTGRDNGDKNVLAYHIRQAFKPGEISPEDANKLGYELAMRFTKGRHAFIVATHIDKRHVHNHIIFNSTDIEARRKFKNYWGTSKVIRRLSDLICLENGLHVIENPKPSKGNYFTWMEHKKDPSLRERLEQLIDEVLAKNPADFEGFVRLLKEAGCEVKQGKHISVKAMGQKRFLRLRSLSDDYTEDAIRERLSGKRTAPKKEAPAVQMAQSAKSPTPPPQAERKFSLLIDVQNSIKAKNSPGYANWAKLFSLKEAAKTFMFLQDNGFDDWESLSNAAQKAKDDFNAIQTNIHAADARMKDITLLQKHIGTYVKTKDIYAEYKRRKFSKKFLSENEKAITDHKAAKAHFDGLKLTKLPTINTLKQEYAALAADKKKLYGSYHQARNFMQEILLAEQNTRMLLNYRDNEQTRSTNREER